jgi:hypothetical protein
MKLTKKLTTLILATTLLFSSIFSVMPSAKSYHGYPPPPPPPAYHFQPYPYHHSYQPYPYHHYPYHYNYYNHHDKDDDDDWLWAVGGLALGYLLF